MPWTAELWLFNAKTHSKIGTLTFEGVEYYDEMITTSYIAVFNLTDFEESISFTNTDYYCISSNASPFLTPVNPNKANSDVSRKELQGKYGFQDGKVLKISSMIYNDITLTLCSFYGENYSANSVLLESYNQKNTVLNEILQDEYVMWDFIITPLSHRKKPVLIMEMGIPDTDNNWTQIGVFNGSQYILQLPNDLVKVE